jgi:hypothetical protein
VKEEQKDILKKCVEAPSGERRRYIVQMSGEKTIEWDDFIEVVASSPAEAIKLADDLVPSNVEIFSSKILSSASEGTG